MSESSQKNDLSNANDYSSQGLKHGLFLSKILSLGAVYFLNERHNNEYSELKNSDWLFSEFKFFSDLI